MSPEVISPITIIVAVVVVITPFIVAVRTPVIGAARLVVEAWGSPDILLDLHISLISVRPVLHHGEQFLDRSWPLTEQLVVEIVEVAVASDESEDGIIGSNVWDGKTRIRETPNVVTQRLILMVLDFL